jgi:hypothetical protein
MLALAIACAIAIAIVVIVTAGGSTTPGTAIVIRPGEHDVTVWAAPGTRPLSDAAAAALVTAQPENRATNSAANDYVPSAKQLAAFHAQARAQPDFNPLTAYVTGRPGLRHPSTDDLIQWVSHKWGIPTNWIRAQLVVESDWQQSERGDLNVVGVKAQRLYPAFSRAPGTMAAYQSLGIAEVKWLPGNAVGAGTEPLRWESTAFNLDYYAASVRYYYDGDCGWCTSGYRKGEAWQSVGAWFAPQPWGNSGAAGYIADVKQELASHPWTKAGF